MRHLGNKKEILSLISVSLSLLSSTAFAWTGHFYVGGDAGASIASLNNANPKITYYNGYLTDAYPLDGSSATTTMLGINGGYEISGNGFVPSIAFGVGFYGTPSHYDYSGNVNETALGDATNHLYNYSYNISSTILMAETKFTWTLKNGLAPFVNAGIGSAWNHLSDYKETVASSDGYLAVPPFQSDTTTNFAYQVGLGLGYAFNFTKHANDFQHERISIGYQYAFLGNTTFGTRGSIYPYKLSPGDLSTQDIYINFTHLF